MRILVADDDAASRKMLLETLTATGCDVQLAVTGPEALAILQGQTPPQLALIDRALPGLDFTQVAQTVRQRQRSTYLMLIAAKTDRKEIIEALEAGADDFLARPWDPLELRARLGAARHILDLRAELAAAKESMGFLATRDFLTGAWNHRAIMEIVDRELHRAQRESRPIAFIMIDLDNFKKINDTHGHMIGDTVLRETARRMTEGIRPYDLLGRCGGEEFLVIAPGSDLEGAKKLAERLRQRLATEPIRIGELLIPVTASFGVAGYASKQPIRASTVLRAADIALYQAKDEGRNRVIAGAPL